MQFLKSNGGNEFYFLKSEGTNKISFVKEPVLILPSLWTFDTPESSTTISNFSVVTNPTGQITINWGDSSSDTVASNSPVNHTY
jgi:hypothetical protein